MDLINFIEILQSVKSLLPLQYVQDIFGGGS